MTKSSGKTIRILVADDEKSILNSYKNIFDFGDDQNESESRIEDLQSKLYGKTHSRSAKFHFDVSYCRQGDDAVRKVRIAVQEGNPYAVIYLDVRMPPGPDGVWAAEQIRLLDPLVNIVIVTAYSDIDPSDISTRVLPHDKLLYVQKPFHAQEIEQFSAALGTKWEAEKLLLNVNEELNKRVKEQTADLLLTNEALEESIQKYKLSEKQLKKTQEELEARAKALEGTTIALQQLVKKNEVDKKAMEDKVLFTVNEMITPYMEKLKKCDLGENAQMYTNIIESNIGEVIAPFMRGLAYKYFRLTPQEIHIANLIKQGRSTKTIASLLKITTRGVEFHRNKIRGKIGIKHTKERLRDVLEKLEIEFVKS